MRHRAVLIAAVLVLPACGGGGGSPSTPGTPAPTPAPRPNSGDPDDDDGGIPTWQAIRNEASLYVDYETGEGELYDLPRDPAQLESRYGAASAANLAPFEQRLGALKACRGASCR